MPTTPLREANALPVPRLSDEVRAFAPGMKLEGRLQPVGPETDFPRLVGGLHHTPFQGPLWLRTWFETIGRARQVQGLWLSVHSAAGQVLALPLILHRRDGLRVLGFPDLGVTDYAAPLLGKPELVAGTPRNLIWSAILSALPEADLLELERSPETICGHPNPLVSHWLGLEARISGWQRLLPQDWETYLSELSPSMRDKIGKSRRRFGRADGSLITRIAEPSEAARLLPLLSAWQAERMSDKGRDYELDDPAIADFYTRLVESGVETGDVMMMALAAEGQPIAINYGFREGSRVVYLRVGNTFGKWSPFAPGILATKAILKEALATGVETFDFGAGDYEYKWRFGAERLPLFDISIPLTPKAWLHVVKLQARRRLSRVEALKRVVTRLRGKGKPAGRGEQE
jgi:CelD/BcsL family acetyltransferase involved in cellulose biosynthesis